MKTPEQDWPPGVPTTYRLGRALYRVTPRLGLLRGKAYHVQPVDEHGDPDLARHAWTCFKKPGGFELVEPVEPPGPRCAHAWLQMRQEPTRSLAGAVECAACHRRFRLAATGEEHG